MGNVSMTNPNTSLHDAIEEIDMALAIIQYSEFLQFSCFTEDPRAMPESVECAGEAFFMAVRITNIIIPNQTDQFFFNPDLVYPESEGAPANAQVGQPLRDHEHFESLLLAPSKGLTFTGSGDAPMLIFRRVEVPSPPGTPTLFTYQANSGDTVVFAPNNPNPIPTTNLADPSMF
jgi:hypothetical protein